MLTLKDLFEIQHRKLKGFKLTHRELKIHESIFMIGFERTLELIKNDKL